MTHKRSTKQTIINTHTHTHTHTHKKSPYLTIMDTANNALSPNGGTTPTINQLVKFTIEYMLCAQNLMLKYIFIL
jgi:hypothetical protein